MRSRSSGTQLFDVASPPAGAGSCSSDEDSPLSTCTSAGEVESQTDLDRVASLSVDSSSLLPVPEHLEHIWSCVTAGGGQVNPEEEQRRSNLLSLTQRVQVNRKILQHLLTNQKTQLDGSQSESREHGDAGFVTNDSNCEILQRDNNNQSLFVSARSLQQQCEDGFRMKRRCVPLRGDHNLLAPSTHTQLGVRLADGLASHPGRLSVSSGGESTRQHPSATRRLRFEDETEMEVESRYLERQWQRRQVAGQRGTSLLVSKPDLSLYINGTAKAGIRVGGCDVDRQHRRTSTGAVQRVGVQCNSCGTVLRGTVNPNLCLHTPTHQPHLNLRTEPIKETYIGSVTPGKARSSQEEGGVGHVSNMQVRRSSNQPELNGNQVPPTTDLPINPYAPTPWSAGWGSKTPSSSPIPPATLAPTSNVRLSGTKVGRVQRQEQEEQGSPAAAKLHTSHQSGAALKERNPCVVEGGSLDLRIKSSSPSSADNQAPPTSERSSDKPTRMKPQSDDPSFPEHFSNRDESSRLSLRHLFSTVRLSRTRTGSLDRLCSRTRPSASNPVPSDSNPASLLKKCPSVQSLSVGSPLLQLRKLSSVQSFGSEQKKKTGRSSVYKPAVDRFLQRCLSVEDVSSPCSSRSVGRVLQVGSDGTFLLELSQPTNRTYGFVISRGRGRRDSGVYVEDMVDSSTEKLYAGLLSVGDEILEVNGEKVACLSLDQVTHLLTQNTSATVRVLRHLRTFPH